MSCTGGDVTHGARRWGATVAAFVMATAAVVSCDDSPTAPETMSAVPLRVGDTVRGSLSAANPASVFTLVAEAGEEVSVLVAVSSGAVDAVLADSAERHILATTRAAVTDSTLAGVPEASASVTLPTTGRYRLRVQIPPNGGPAAYLLTVPATNRAPEHTGSAMAMGDTIATERLEHAGDIDEFVLSIGGEALAALFVAGPPTRGPIIDAVVLDEAAGGVLGAASARSAASTLSAQASGRFLFPRAGTYRVRVRGRPGSGVFPAPYRVHLFPIDARPEQAAARINLSDTTSGESVTPLGDVDEFTFDGTAGAEVNVFLQARSGRPSDKLIALVVDSAGTPLGAVQSVGVDTALTRQASGRIRLPRAGSYAVLVYGESDTTGGDLGAYRLHVNGVREPPEIASATLAAGSRVTGEVIELPGDVDAYLVTVSSPTRVNIELRHQSQVADSLRAELTDSSGRKLASVVANTGIARGSGAFTLLAPGTYRLRVFGAASTGAGFRGAYQLVLHHILGATPEVASAVIAPGDTVSDAIDPPGDEDVYTFSARKREHFHVHLQGLGVGGGYFTAVVRDAGTKRMLGTVWSGVAEPSLGDRRTIRLTMPGTGTYEVVVSSEDGGREVGEQGPYRLALLKVPVGPEHVAPTLTVGDSIGAERFDHPGDIDRFLLTGAPGQEIIAYFDYDGGPSTCVRLAVLDTASADSLRVGISCGFAQTTGRFVLPGDGVVALEAYEPVFCGEFGCHESFSALGPYRLQIGAVNRAPESTASAIAYGDTVHGGWDGVTMWGEWVKPIGDVDEFTFSGAAADTVEVLFQTPNGTWTFNGIRIELLDPRSGTVLGSTTSVNPDSLGARRIGPVVLPAAGSYLIRVMGVEESYGDNRFGAGPYQFALRRIGGPR